MRSLMAASLSLLLASTAHVMSAEYKATSRIDAVTVYPAGAEVTRVGRMSIEGGEHVILFTDLPAELAARFRGKQHPETRAEHRTGKQTHEERAAAILAFETIVFVSHATSCRLRCQNRPSVRTPDRQPYQRHTRAAGAAYRPFGAAT